MLNKKWLIDNDVIFRCVHTKSPQREHLLPLDWKEHWEQYLEKYTSTSGKELDELVAKSVNQIGNAFLISEWSNSLSKK